MRKLMFICLTLFFVLFLGSCKPKVAEKDIPPENSTEVGYTEIMIENDDFPYLIAAELYTQFKNDSAAAMNLYKDKKFNITGVIEVIDEDEIGRPYVVLGKAGGDGFNAVTFIFTKNDQTELSLLKMGDTATIKGTVHDYLMNVIIYDCSILSIKK